MGKRVTSNDEIIDIYEHASTIAVPAHAALGLGGDLD